MYDKYDEVEEALVVEEKYPNNSIATSDLPSTVHGDASSTQDAIETGNGEQLLWIEQNGYKRRCNVRRVHPPATPHEDARSNRVGWIAKVICYLCYERAHLAADCTCGIRGIPKVISNFEKLTDSEKTSVPDTYYQNALRFIRGSPDNYYAKDVGDTSQPLKLTEGT